MLINALPFCGVIANHPDSFLRDYENNVTGNGVKRKGTNDCWLL
jgi:hypothetical protein